jgi:hypothetical protein
VSKKSSTSLLLTPRCDAKFPISLSDNDRIHENPLHKIN